MMTSQTQTLPTDIEFDILIRLPIKTLSRFKSVSKPWLTIITDPHFIRAHLQQSSNQSRKFIFGTPYVPSVFYSLDFKSPNDPQVQLDNFSRKLVSIISSCYGLLLVFMHIDKQYVPFLWNPSTSIYRRIPLPDDFKASDICGLGYDSTTDDFKIVMVVDPVLSDYYQSPSVAHVFSSRTSSWKKIQDFPCLKSCHYFRKNVVLDGVLYWVAMSGTIYCHISCSKYVIMCFDPNVDEMKELPSPIHERNFKLTVLGGNLCLVNNHEIGIDVWVMKESSWSKMLGFTHSSYFDFLCYKDPQNHRSLCAKPLCFTGENDGGVVILIYGRIVLFNIKENTFKLIEFPPALEHSFTNAECYVESLVSPYVGFGTRSYTTT